MDALTTSQNLTLAVRDYLVANKKTLKLKPVPGMQGAVGIHVNRGTSRTFAPFPEMMIAMGVINTAGGGIVKTDTHGVPIVAVDYAPMDRTRFAALFRRDPAVAFWAKKDDVQRLLTDYLANKAVAGSDSLSLDLHRKAADPREVDRWMDRVVQAYTRSAVAAGRGAKDKIAEAMRAAIGTTADEFVKLVKSSKEFAPLLKSLRKADSEGIVMRLRAAWESIRQAFMQEM